MNIIQPPNVNIHKELTASTKIKQILTQDPEEHEFKILHL